MGGDTEMNDRKSKPSLQPVDSPTAPPAEGASKVEYWRAILKRWRLSGLTKHAFCKRNSIRLNTFNIWCIKLNSDKFESSPADDDAETKILQLDRELLAGKEACVGKTVIAEIRDSSGKLKLRIYDSARAELVNEMISSFLSERSSAGLQPG